MYGMQHQKTNTKWMEKKRSIRLRGTPDPHSMQNAPQTTSARKWDERNKMLWTWKTPRSLFSVFNRRAAHKCQQNKNHCTFLPPFPMWVADSHLTSWSVDLSVGWRAANFMTMRMRTHFSYGNIGLWVSSRLLQKQLHRHTHTHTLAHSDAVARTRAHFGTTIYSTTRPTVTLLYHSCKWASTLLRINNNNNDSTYNKRYACTIRFGKNFIRYCECRSPAAPPFAQHRNEEN